MCRVLKPGGRALIYAWAFDQNKDQTPSTYLKQNASQNGHHKVHNNKAEVVANKADEFPLVLPVHTNRTDFQHSDVLVPWSTKNKDTFHRFYHVFHEGELSDLINKVPGAKVEEVYYDQGNWCVIFKKMESDS